MSTINPNAIDDTKPVQGDPTTASVRANETATKTQLQNAKNDIEALEPHPPRTDNPHNVTAAQTGAAPLAHTHVLADITDSGTAASRDVGALAANVPDITIADGRYEAAGAVAAHEAAGDPHSQYLTPAEGDAVYAPLSHVGATGAAHGDFSSVVAGFTPASGGGTTNFLRADGAWAVPPGGGGGGSFDEVTKDGASISVGRKILEFRDSGDATVTVTDDAGGDRAIIEINATAGAGSGGIGAGAPFVVGDIMQVESAAGDGTAQTIGVSGSSLSAHLANGSIHIDHTGVTLSAGNGLTGGGDITASRTFTVGAGDGIQVNANDVQVDATVARTANLGTAAARDIGTAAANVPDITIADGRYLQSVSDDTAPALGGDLQTQNSTIIIQDAAGETGRIGATSTNDGAYLGHTSDSGFDPNDGAVGVFPASIELYGSVITAVGMKHTTAGGRQVYVGEDGGLFSVEPPETGWESSDTDTGSYDLGSGTGQAPTYTQMTGLTVQPAQDINIGDRFDYQIRAWVENKTTNRSGVIEFSVGINGAQPAQAGNSVPIGPGFAGYVNVSVTVPSAASAIATTDNIDVFARRVSGDNAQFGVDLVGTPNEHSFFVSVPGQGGTGPANYTESHSWAIAGDVGDATYPGFFVVGSEPATVATVRHRVSAGTCTGQLLRDGANLGPSFEINTTDSSTTINVAAATDERIELQISGGATPQNLMATVRVERTFQ